MARRNRLVAPMLLVSALMVGIFAMSAAHGAAQEIQFGAQTGPYYVGEPVVVQVVLKGVDSQVDVSCRLTGTPPAGVTVQGPQVGQSVQSYIQIINGRRTSRNTVDYQYRFIVTASKEGEYFVGPFEVTANGQPQKVEGRSFTFGQLENDPDMQISLAVPQSSIYVGQEVPLTISWSFAGDIDAVRYAFSNMQIRSPLFDQIPFRDERATSRTTLTIVTAKGTVEVPAEVAQKRVDGRDFITVTGRRTMVPDAPGQFREIPITCRTQKVTQWGRSVFGDPVARRRAPALAAGTPLNLVVKPIPRSDRPKSFAGAVGKGFSIEVSANRSVVRVGDPISLNVAIRGDGNLSRVSLPPLAANPGLENEQFLIPQDQATGTIEGNQKQFKVTVRVNDAAIEQIPPIAFSWFDPYAEQFRTAVSKPIALQVMETHVVSAADVVSSSGGRSGGVSRSGDADTAGTEAARSAAMSAVGANLAITRDVAQLLASDSIATSSRVVAASCYGLAGVFILCGILFRRQAARDQDLLGRKKRLEQLAKRVRSAEKLPPKEAAGDLGRALRDLLAEDGAGERDSIEKLISRCDNILYSTDDRQTTVDVSEIADAAKQLVKEATV